MQSAQREGIRAGRRGGELANELLCDACILMLSEDLGDVREGIGQSLGARSHELGHAIDGVPRPLGLDARGVPGIGRSVDAQRAHRPCE